MITKEIFIDTINFLDVIIKENKTDQQTVLFLKRIFILLPLCFENTAQAKEEIEYYCFHTNFGKPTPDSEYITPAALFEKLI